MPLLPKTLPSLLYGQPSWNKTQSSSISNKLWKHLLLTLLIVPTCISNLTTMMTSSFPCATFRNGYVKNQMTQTRHAKLMIAFGTIAKNAVVGMVHGTWLTIRRVMSSTIGLNDLTHQLDLKLILAYATPPLQIARTFNIHANAPLSLLTMTLFLTATASNQLNQWTTMDLIHRLSTLSRKQGLAYSHASTIMTPSWP